ncbi:leucine-rich repeat domain-containing protein [Akkermansiaceae bacterium]|nr:leucine-rich repeat domain-containing protein [Akkermansiaceae bacterium]MDB4379180.1 leucine-rich repeat domain-containing protein [Akkermansiaceae bacterium]MDB4432620.1 leucine-rich repeat domain-containing protein [Akkermansiaceae bacterium]MDB4563279.1 leucine-rich repeat domain-containing protein [bacterium]
MKPIQALLALFAFAFLPLHAASLDDLTWTTTAGEVTITDCNEAATGELIIPDTIEGKPVTSIGLDTFRSCTSLTSITIPDGVTSIGERAFRECTSLTSITIPDSVTSIGEVAFQFCTSLTSITIPNSVTSIGEGAFWRCISLTSITIPDGFTSIGSYTFRECYSLTSITIPDSVTSIGRLAFKGCSSLTSITIPDGVPSIADWAFAGCSSLTSITIPDSVTSIGERAFRDCTNLTSITFQGAAPTVGTNAFLDVANGAVALVTLENHASFGNLGVEWNGLTVSMSAAYLNELLTRLNSHSAAVATARTAGQGDVTSDPASYSLVTQTSYNAVVAERDARPTLAVLDTEVVTARTAGQSDVTSDPASYSLVTQTSYNAVVAERDARPTLAVLDTEVVTARTAGQSDVTSDPTSYSLVTQTSYNAVVAERDARPTAEQLAAVEAERDARPTQVSYDSAVAASRVAGQDDVTTNPSNYNLTTGEVTQTLDLKAGWNLVSFYVEADDMTPATVFAPIQNKLLLVKNLTESYDPTLTADFAFLNTLSSLNMKDGYWINVSEDVSLDVEGQVGTVVEISELNFAAVKTQSDHSPEEKAGPTWGEATVYPNLGATVLAKVSIQGKPVAKGGVVAAFVGNELRGIQDVILNDGISYVTLNVNLNGAESVSYRVWNPNENNEYLVSGTMLLELGSMYGKPELMELDAVTVVSKPLQVFKLTSEPFGFSFNTTVDRSYTVEATGDLRSWKAVELFQGSGGEIRFTAEPTSSGKSQFFRVFVK